MYGPWDLRISRSALRARASALHAFEGEGGRASDTGNGRGAPGNGWTRTRRSRTVDQPFSLPLGTTTATLTGSSGLHGDGVSLFAGSHFALPRNARDSAGGGGSGREAEVEVEIEDGGGDEEGTDADGEVGGRPDGGSDSAWSPVFARGAGSSPPPTFGWSVDRLLTPLFANDPDDHGTSLGMPRCLIERLRTYVHGIGGRDHGNDVAGPDARDDVPSAEEPSPCAICMEEPEAGQTMRALPCGHAYHSACIDRWLASHVECPCCRGRPFDVGALDESLPGVRRFAREMRARDAADASRESARAEREAAASAPAAPTSGIRIVRSSPAGTAGGNVGTFMAAMFPRLVASRLPEIPMLWAVAQDPAPVASAPRPSSPGPVPRELEELLVACPDEPGEFTAADDVACLPARLLESA